jgi:hypothetical protein
MRHNGSRTKWPVPRPPPLVFPITDIPCAMPHKLQPEGLLLNASHTQSGPEFRMAVLPLLVVSGELPLRLAPPRARVGVVSPRGLAAT